MLCIYLQDRSMCSLQCAERLEAQRQTETWWAAEHLGPVDLPIPAWETEITQAMSFVHFWSTYITCVLPVYICVTLFYPAECVHLCVCTYLCVYGMSREKRRKLAAPWSSLVWKNSSSTEGSLTRATQSWFSRRTSSASTTPPVSAGGRRWLKDQVTN